MNEPTKSRPSVLRSFWTKRDSIQGGHSWYTTMLQTGHCLLDPKDTMPPSMLRQGAGAFKFRGTRDDLWRERDAVAGVKGTLDGSSGTRRKIELHSPYL